METFAINTDFDKKIDSRHVAFCVIGDQNSQELQMIEIVENTYFQPNSDEQITISVLERKHVLTIKRSDPEFSEAMILKYSDNLVRRLLANRLGR
jgi:hypothetical protein